MKNYKYYDLILGAYVCVLLCANLIGPAKVSTVNVPIIGDVTFVAGVLFFPFSYFFGDILTEVYGYARDRRVVWSGFGALLFASFMATVIVHLPPAEFWKANQPAVDAIFGSTPRDHRRLHHCVLERLLRKQLRAGKDEDPDPWTLVCGHARSVPRCAVSWWTPDCSTPSRSTACGLRGNCSAS